MGVESKRPPLPAPTEPTDNETDVATNVSRRTDQTSYSVPEDGSPITISTHKLTSKESPRLRHGRNKSQTSLLIEYFEASKGEKGKARPSVRVKVTPSSHRKQKSASDAVQITGIGRDRKPSYTRRISLGNKNVEAAEAAATATATAAAPPPAEGTEVSHSSGSNTSGLPPVEVEILNNHSEASTKSRDLYYLPTPSDVSSMPPDSLLDPSQVTQQSPDASQLSQQSLDPSQVSQQSLDLSQVSQAVSEEQSQNDHRLDPPKDDRARSASHERIKQKVMEKLLQRQRGEGVEYEPDTKPSKERRRRSSRSTREDDLASAAESSILSSNLSASNASYVSGTSKVSLNNPKLLQMVEDTVRRLILPEITQLKNEQRRTSSHSYTDDDLDRRLSKSSSSPNISSKPKVVLNRYDDDPGEVLSRGDSERREKTRRSSRGESDRSRRRSSRTSTSESTKDSHRSKDVAVAGLAGGLTAAALRSHDSQDTVSRERRRKRKSKDSRSGSRSVTETERSYRKKEIPPMPWTGGTSGINDSDVTRDSILSAATECPRSSGDTEPQTPIREVPRGSVGGSLSPASTTPRGFSSPRHLESIQSRSSLAEDRPSSAQSVHSISTRARIAALAAAGLIGAEAIHRSDKERSMSPTQTVSTSGESMHDPLVPPGLRPRSRVSELSAEYEERQRNAMSPHSAASSPTTTTHQERRSFDFHQGPESPGVSFDDPESPNELEEWFQREHEKNEQYRQSLADSTTLPDPKNAHSLAQDDHSSDSERQIQGVAATPRYASMPHAVESAVASLVDPSMISSSVHSSQDSTSRAENSQYREHTDEHARQGLQDQPAADHAQYPTQNRWSALREHALALSNRGSSGHPTAINSPQSDTQSLREKHARSIGSPPIQLGASGIPDVNDPMPEIGHGVDSESDLSTNPPEIQGPGTGGEYADPRFAFRTSPSKLEEQSERRDSISEHSYKMANAALLGAGAAAGALAADHALHHNKEHRNLVNQATVEDYDSRETTPDMRQAEARRVGQNRSASPGAHVGDEGYASAAYARSTGASTPKASKSYTKEQLADYEAAMAGDDPFIGKHTRHMSGNSHGIASPLYDSATGKGIESIQSKDVVALMDHLTVRDAQRNARDTEILVTLVRSAAEMRQSFDEMKKYIAEQDRKIMENTDRDAEYTVKKILGGPRPPPVSVPRTPRASYDDEGMPVKRKNVFKRALKGLSMRSSKDLTKIEDMLNQLLGDVEDLKHTQGGDRPPMSLRGSSFDSYEDRAYYGRESGYEPEGQAGTSSSGHLSNQSGNLGPAPNKQDSTSPKDRWFHSGYNGRRDSINRVSTVMEEDSNDGGSLLDQHETQILNNQFENNERLLTPTQERYNRQSVSSGSTATPPQQHQSLLDGKYSADSTPEKQPKHKSNGSFSFGVPKMSRWSKTTSSSAPENFDVYGKRRSQYTDASKSGDSLDSGSDGYYGNGYTLQSDDRLRSTQSLARENDVKESRIDNRSVRSGLSDMTRTPSPLIPSETGSQSNEPRAVSPIGVLDEFEDPKYQAHRNSVLLQHPQPRPGPTHRHQTNLENEARTFSGPDHFESGTDSDLSQRTVESDFDPLQWGSNPSLSLARTNKISGISNAKDDGPLVPQNKPAVAPRVEVEQAKDGRQQAQQKDSRPVQRQMYYSSPLGSGHLLEPIEEVRYSLETDSGHRSPDPSASPRVANRPSPGRKITGPRPMGSRSISATANEETAEQRSGTVRRKPVPSIKSYDNSDGWGTWGRKER